MCKQLTLTNCTTAYPTPPITILINTYSCQLLERGGGGGGRIGRAGGRATSIWLDEGGFAARTGGGTCFFASCTAFSISAVVNPEIKFLSLEELW